MGDHRPGQSHGVDVVADLVGTIKLVERLLQQRHELGQQMTVLQEHPEASGDACCDELQGTWPHALPKRQMLQAHAWFHAHLLSWRQITGILSFAIPVTIYVDWRLKKAFCSC